MNLPNQPAQLCEPPVFRTPYRLNARIALRTSKTMFLAVLRAPEETTAAKLTEHLLRNCFHGELLCEMSPLTFYMQLFAANEEAAQVILTDLTDEVPRVSAHLSPLPKE